MEEWCWCGATTVSNGGKSGTDAGNHGISHRAIAALRERLDAPIDAPETVLSKDEWKVLWLSTEHNHPLPKMPPFAHWAFYAIAKLGGFADTKCTGRPSWDTVWHGWFRLRERINGYQLSKSVFAEL